MRKRSVSAELLLKVSPCAIAVSACFALTPVEPASAQSVIMKNGPSEGRELKFAAQSLTPAQPTPSQSDAAARPDDPKVSDERPTSPNATASLVNALVKKGVLTEEQANAIIKQADDESYVGREASKDASERAAEAAKAAKEAALAASPPGTKHVSYVPDVVKRQLRDEIRAEVMAKAQKENWASPGKYPEWASRIHFYGDVRTRYEGIFYPDGNAPGGYFPNFNAINTGSPYDYKNLDSPYPRFDTDQDRNRFRIRARLGLDADLSEGFTAGMRFATGDSSSPVSPNQSFGTSGGNFSKYSLWLDRAYLKYQPLDEVSVSTGRIDNPFFDPTDLVWDPDLGFDGAVVQGKYAIRPDLIPFLVAGAFPIFNTDLNFATNQDYKFNSDDRYLFGGQVGLGWKPDSNISIKVGAAYYDFTNVQGKQSSECVVLNASSACDTDALRPSFAQKGNTYMPLRHIKSTPGSAGNNNGTEEQFQYYGLASDFRDLVITAQADLGYFEPYHVIVDGAFVQNLAFDRGEIEPVAVNNFGAGTLSTGGPFEGGSVGWFARTTVGYPKLMAFGDWNASIGYKYLESDAIIDAFADSDFGLGGTNLKGFFLGGNLALSKNVSTSVKGYSATSVAGPTYAVDILQLDLNAKF